MKKITLGLLTVLFIVSCSKPANTPKSSLSERPINSVLRIIEVSPNNTSNSIDSVGILHNIFLIYGETQNIPNDSTHMEDWVEAINTSSVQNGGNGDITLQETLDSLQSFTLYGIYPKIDTNSVIGSNINTLRNTVLGRFNNGNSTYTIIKADIVAWESSVSANNLFTQEEKNELLTFSSILRHSIHFWSEKQNLPDDEINAISAGAGIVDAVAGFIRYKCNPNDLSGWDRLKDAATFGSTVSKIAEIIWAIGSLFL